MKTLPHDTKVPVGTGPVMGANGASAKSGSGKASASGSLAAAPAGKGADLGGNIVGFGSGKPDASTVNAVGGKLGSAPVAPSVTQVAGFSGSGVKPGKI